MNFTTLFAGSAAFGILIAIWDHVKLYWSKFINLFIVTIEFNEYSIKESAASYFNLHYTRSRTSKINVVERNAFVNTLKKYATVLFYHSPEEPTIYFKGWKPISVCLVEEPKMSTISFIRWTFDPVEILTEIQKNLNKMDLQEENGDSSIQKFTINRFSGSARNNNMVMSKNNNEVTESYQGRRSRTKNILKPVTYKMEDIGQNKVTNSLETMALSKESENLVSEIKMWLDSEDWYKEKQIPFKKSILIQGKPGTGKSSFIRNVAMKFDLPLNIFDIGSMTNDEFYEFWKQSMVNAPCINLIEDIDGVFEGRKNITNPERGLTFDCLLNTLDGVENTEGVLSFITTNHIEKIDAALASYSTDESIASRPGRIDKIVTMNAPNEAGRYHIARRILKENPETIDQVVKDGENDSGAQFQERCSSLALKLYWINKNNSLTVAQTPV